jgi:hypothetical protein
VSNRCNRPHQFRNRRTVVVGGGGESPSCTASSRRRRRRPWPTWLTERTWGRRCQLDSLSSPPFSLFSGSKGEREGSIERHTHRKTESPERETGVCVCVWWPTFLSQTDFKRLRGTPPIHYWPDRERNNKIVKIKHYFFSPFFLKGYTNFWHPLAIKLIVDIEKLPTN